LTFFSGRITDIGCAHIAKIESLESLELCGGGVTNIGCAHLAMLKNLSSLNLSQNIRITNTGVSSLVALTKLKALNLSNTRVSAGSLKTLSNLLHLQSLALYGCDDIKNLDQIRALPSLKCLRIESSSEDNGKVGEDACRNINADSDTSTDSDIDDEEIASSVFHDDSISLGSRSSFDTNDETELEYEPLNLGDNSNDNESLLSETNDGEDIQMEDLG